MHVGQEGIGGRDRPGHERASTRTKVLHHDLRGLRHAAGAGDAQDREPDGGQGDARDRPGGGGARSEVAVQESEPPGLAVTAIGEVPTSGWENAVLVRVVYDKPPADGIQDYILFADRPSGVVAEVISRVVAKNTWKGYKKQAPWLK